MSNRLAHETSPYLLQHRDNPVDWYPWGAEAFARAVSENKPVLVSIGYSACHWCHVMAHESFENPAIARQLNDSFICIKVDREERPDIDAIYMSAVQGMVGHGGWPLNAFTTPDGTPFFGGTYWPPTDRAGMPGFPRVLTTLATTWISTPEKLLENADQVRAFLQNSTVALPADPLTNAISHRAIESLTAQFDPVWGGFGKAPKFPQTPVLEFLLREAAINGNAIARDMALTTLDRIAAGGIHDQLAGGFARYSVDNEWLVPHFEKMLYDNAQLMLLYVDAFKITGVERYREIVRSIVTWAKSEMLSQGGDFCAALDADSEGEEGKFYVWTSAEIDRLLTPEEADLVRIHYGVSESGNFENGTSILHIARPLQSVADSIGRELRHVEVLLASAQAKLRQQRSTRVRPNRDDKIITSWNALMIKALVNASDILDDSDLLAMATTSAHFIRNELVSASGHLRHSWKDQQTRGDGILEDYALLADALIDLYRVTTDSAWLDEANRLVDIVITDFTHDSGVGFFDTGQHHEKLATRPRDLQDNATPSGNSVMADVLLTIGTYRQDERLLSASRSMLEGLVEPMSAHPTAFGRALAATVRHLGTTRELVFAGDPESDVNRSLRQVAARRSLPDIVVGFADPADPSVVPMLADRPPIGTGAAYLCQHNTCLPPVTDPAQFANLLQQ